MPLPFRQLRRLVLLAVIGILPVVVFATPANRAALEKHYDRFLAKPLARCTTCHRPNENKFPESLGEFPHNPFGERLRKLGEELAAAGRKQDIPTRLAVIANEDTDGDGAANEAELLLGRNPGDAKDTPSTAELAQADSRRAEFTKYLAGYRWQPFEPVVRPPVPTDTHHASRIKFRNPIDSFLAVERDARGLKPRPEAPKEILLRRVCLDLIGLNPTPEEQRAFLEDTSPDAYERLVDRLLDDPRHGERWARHWMDVWRYSDWAGWADGGQIRDSQRHIWRWRDWIVESLNADKPYDRMVTEMLAADEVAPEDPDALRATGFLVRNYKMLSREQWLEDTVKHTAQALLGVTMGCAKCHDHMMDPISQREYYALRAVFEPHQVRTDRVSGELDLAKDGLPRAYDVTNAPTFVFVRGDERHPLTNTVIPPAVPAVLGGRLDVQEVKLPWLAANPDQRDFVIRDTVAAGEKSVAEAKAGLTKTRGETNATPTKLRAAELTLDLAEKKLAALVAVVEVERMHVVPPSGGTGAPTPATDESTRSLAVTFLPPKGGTTNAVLLQRTAAVAEAKLKQHQAQAALAAAATNKLDEAKKKLTEADQQLAAVIEVLAKPLDAAFTPRPAAAYPTNSTGRRRAFAQWLTDPRNPLTARVAVNHVWLRHFGRGLVPTPADFGRNGRPATHPQLLDWLAAEFMKPETRSEGLKSYRVEESAIASSSTLQHLNPSTSRPWSFRHLHRLIVTSAAYRMASSVPSSEFQVPSSIDPDNHLLWRMNSRRLEAEAVRDNVLHAAGTLDPTLGGPDIDHLQALTSPRRSLYLRHAAEKQAEFLQIFDGAAVTECYERRPSVMPQQALALNNSELALKQARLLAAKLILEGAVTAVPPDSSGSRGNEALNNQKSEPPHAVPHGAEPDSAEARLVELAFQRILARRPTDAERQSCVDFFGPAPVSAELAEKNFARAAENLVLVLFNHNDFVTVR